MNELITKFTLYGTFGTGQPYYPGYFIIEVEAETKSAAQLCAQHRMNAGVGNKWCRLYDSLEAVHEGDRIFRGTA